MKDRVKSRICVVTAALLIIAGAGASPATAQTWGGKPPNNDPASDPNQVQSIYGQPVPGGERQLALSDCMGQVMPAEELDNNDLSPNKKFEYTPERQAAIKKCMNQKGFIFGAETPVGADGKLLPQEYTVDEGVPVPTQVAGQDRSGTPQSPQGAMPSDPYVPGGVAPENPMLGAALPKEGATGTKARLLPVEEAPPAAPPAPKRPSSIFVSPDANQSAPKPVFLNR